METVLVFDACDTSTVKVHRVGCAALNFGNRRVSKRFIVIPNTVDDRADFIERKYAIVTCKCAA